jgi:di/tricarboxylate transporter
MDWESWTMLGMLGVVFTLLAFTHVGPDIILWGAVTLLMTLRIITPAEALSGLANEGMVTVGLLFVVAAGLRETGGMHRVTQRLLGRPQSVKVAQLRLMGPVAAMSAFMNNTPLVAMLLPVVDEWARQLRLSASKFMIPLSYATILGGTCSLIGTSTNLVVNGLLARTPDLPTLGMFDIAWVGIPCTVIGLSYLLLSNRWLLPDRRPAFSTQDDPREYTVEMQVEVNSPLVGQTIEQAGLRHLPGLYLMEIERNGEVVAAVSPQERLHAKDQLVFVGVVESVVDLQKVRGLIPATDQVFKLQHPRTQRSLIEAVVSDSCPVVGMTIRDGRFRNLYDAVVIAVARNGERLRRKIGDIVLRAGDTLLLEARPSFVEQQRNSRDFFLVSQVENSTPRRHERAWVALAILGLMVTVVTLGWLSMLNAAMLAAGLMMLMGCCSATVARRSVDWQVLFVIAAAFGIERAMQKTGTASLIAHTFLGLAGDNPWAALAVVYGVTMLLTELLTNNAAAALMFPIAIATAASLGVQPLPFAIVVMLAASYGFATPIGYQTNLMVYGPGGYRFADYLRIGIPLDLLMGLTAVLVTPLVWPFK